MFSSKSPKQPENVLSHWFVPMAGYHFSTLEFYNRVEADLTTREVPRLRSKRVEYHEGGTFSDKRLYLRLARERFSFEVCAAPFGTGYFFSLRFVEVPRGGWFMLLLLVIAASAVIGLIGKLLLFMTYDATGWFWIGMGVANAAAIVAVASLQIRPIIEPAPDATRLAKLRIRQIPDFDSIVLSLPVIGEWYERVRKETYYRHDTRLMYHTVVSEVVKNQVEEMTVTKGIKLLQTYDYNPILTDFYKTGSLENGSDDRPPPHAVD